MSDYGEVIDKFRSIGADAGILTFDSLHPRYSFVLEDEGGLGDRSGREASYQPPRERRVLLVREGLIILWKASGGWFSKTPTSGGVFYLSPALNEMVLQGHRVATWRIPAERYHPLKDQRQFQILEHQWEERKRHAS